MAELENDDVEEGYFYELSHAKLPPESPEHLYSVRVVMVFKKDELKVSLRFPSVYSLSAYFGNDSYRNGDKRMVPVLDERHDMDLEIAVAVLRRRVSLEEFEVRRKFSSFWAPGAIRGEGSSRQVDGDGGDHGSGEVGGSKVVSSKSSCVSLLKCTGLVQWGSRRQVRYLGRSKPVEKDTLTEQAHVEEDKNNEVEEEEDYKDMKATRSITKRKFNGSEHKEIVKRAKCHNSGRKTKLMKNSIDRWSEARYKLAEQNMLKIMKAKGAVIGNPILRPALRAEARKLIGDTGLLDHLLKHMAGKLAPGGNDRFRRRHNSDGAMEYWLESADLADIRRKAGVSDSYWTPPPGWKLGDNPTQDPICARELKALKEENVNMKMKMELIYRDMQESMFREIREMWKVIDGMKKGTELGFKRSEENVQLVDHVGYFLLLKETFVELVNKKTNIEKELMEIYDKLSKIEVQKVNVFSLLSTCLVVNASFVNVQEQLMKTKNGVRVLSDSEKWETTIEKGEKSKSETKSRDHGRDKAPAAMTVENKAAKTQRLKSGFRICKPQGTFLWPNPTTFNQTAAPLVVQTPPSASSSTLSPVPHFFFVPQSPSGPQSPPPVKPVPVRYAPLSSISEGRPLNTPDLKTPSSSVINLNEVPMEENNSNAF
ncbi:protein DYAD [Humulus lupulus]|uniref:protein DYAD n=1 Tax=Humulus lupulus TaxID=3486 RepID=UPI002B406CA8|nr:protein DYAD [Humulus lupulus]